MIHQDLLDEAMEVACQTVGLPKMDKDAMRRYPAVAGAVVVAYSSMRAARILAHEEAPLVMVDDPEPPPLPPTPPPGPHFLKESESSGSRTPPSSLPDPKSLEASGTTEVKVEDLDPDPELGDTEGVPVGASDETDTSGDDGDSHD